MTIRAYSVSGDAVVDETAEPDQHGDLPLLKEADPQRTIRRYDERGESLPVYVRLNQPLLAAARDLPILVFRLSPAAQPVSNPGADPASRQGRRDWISEGLDLYWNVFEHIERSAFHACYLADRFGPDPNRTHYFVSEQPGQVIELVQDLARTKEFSVACEQTELHRIAADFLPIELVGHLGLAPQKTGQQVKAGFGFWGHEHSLKRLRSALERDGYAFDAYMPHLRELRMTREAPVDPASFLQILQHLVPLSRSLGCSYRGEETAGGHEQFLLTSPKPERYYPQSKSFMSRLFGR